MNIHNTSIVSKIDAHSIEISYFFYVTLIEEEKV